MCKWVSCFSLFPPAFLVINLNSFGLFASVFLSAFPSFLFLYRSVFYQILEYLPCLFISFIILYLPPLFLFFSSSFFFFPPSIFGRTMEARCVEGSV